MRWDQKINLWYWLAGAALAVALMPIADLVATATPQHKIVFMAAATTVALLCFLRAVSLAWRDEEKAPASERRRKMIPLIGMAISGVAFIGFAAWFFWPDSASKNAAATPSLQTASFPKLEDYFAKDFNFLSIDRVVEMKIENPAESFQTTVPIKLRIFRDFGSNSEFVAIFIPFLTDTRLSAAPEGIIEHLKENIKQAREEAKLIGVESKTPGTAIARSSDLVFSGRVFVYTLNSLDAVQIGRLVDSYRKDGMFLEIRGSDYLYYRSKT